MYGPVSQIVHSCFTIRIALATEVPYHCVMCMIPSIPFFYAQVVLESLTDTNNLVHDPCACFVFPNLNAMFRNMSFFLVNLGKFRKISRFSQINARHSLVFGPQRIQLAIFQSSFVCWYVWYLKMGELFYLNFNLTPI